MFAFCSPHYNFTDHVPDVKGITFLKWYATAPR
jgi:hypothetical protein